MSVLLGWAIYAAIAALMVFGVPVLLIKLDRTLGYWKAVGVLLGVFGAVIALVVALYLLIILGMWAGDLVSGRVRL